MAGVPLAGPIVSRRRDRVDKTYVGVDPPWIRLTRPDGGAHNYRNLNYRNLGHRPEVTTLSLLEYSK